MADRLTGDNLAAILREKRGERNQSLARISRDLHAEYGVEASIQTIKNWCDLLGIEKAAQVGS